MITKINRPEATSVMINLICMKLLLTFPRYILSIAGNAAWIVSIYSTIIMLLIFFIIDKIYRTDKSILQIADNIGGKYFKIITGIILFIIILLNMCFTLRVFPESVRMILLHNTPMSLIILLFVIAAALGTYNGIEALARITSFFLPIVLVILLLFVILLYPHYSLKNITPIFGNGQKAIFFDGVEGITLFSDLIALNMLLPMCKSRKKAFESGYKAIIISGIAMTVILAAIGLVYPSTLSNEFIMPVYQLTRLVSIGNFFSRFEAFFEFIWTITMLLYVSVYVYILCIIWKASFELKYYKPLVLPIIILCTAIAYIPESLVTLLTLYSTLKLYMYILIFLLPILYGLLERIRNK